MNAVACSNIKFTVNTYTSISFTQNVFRIKHKHKICKLYPQVLELAIAKTKNSVYSWLYGTLKVVRVVER